jgi:hypothetical protein
MDGIHKSIFLWGLICLVGFGVYQFTLMDPAFPKPLPVWTALVIIGIIGMIKWVPDWQKSAVVHVWLGVNVIGIAYHWAFANKILPAIIPSPWAYWALIMAIGFVLTAYYWKDNFWYYVGGLNFLFFVVVFFMPQTLGTYASAGLAIVGGIPTMYYGWTGK